MQINIMLQYILISIKIHPELQHLEQFNYHIQSLEFKQNGLIFFFYKTDNLN